MQDPTIHCRVHKLFLEEAGLSSSEIEGLLKPTLGEALGNYTATSAGGDHEALSLKIEPTDHGEPDVELVIELKVIRDEDPRVSLMANRIASGLTRSLMLHSDLSAQAVKMGGVSIRVDLRCQFSYTRMPGREEMERLDRERVVVSVSNMHGY